MKNLSTNLLAAAVFVCQPFVAHASLLQDVAPAWGVSPEEVSKLLSSSNTSDIDVQNWIHPFGVNFGDQLAWDEETKNTYLMDLKLILKENLGNEMSKRQTNAAREAVKSASRRALGERDSRHRRLIDLSCDKRSKTACLVCKGLCGVAYVSADGLCSAAALTAAAGSGGTLTAPAGIALAGCLGLATSAYGVCVTTCIRS
ncbi:uncharacterized protein CTRU02_204416 [Colletotrichum truncatum]|uniref:Uncharacterized protein n=1 Tax=Colletotrichum truncatum TaxID=5467 RepID=A0ACC3ZBY5_COLTU|nr:uncharacterized protein CTRU02_14396 [Colletotrichum truncatum]KAF6782209.1 hypothetical protein CTRU02_14396 [Colletotrichum truncatum]